jgi:hypothetical protein
MSDKPTRADLIEIYHRIFDLKDTTKPGSDEAVHCYNALQAIGVLINDAGGSRPLRSDGEGRPDVPPEIKPLLQAHLIEQGYTPEEAEGLLGLAEELGREMRGRA